MIDIIKQYLSHAFREISTSYCVWFLVLFIVGTAFNLIFRGFKKGVKWSAGLLLLEYMALLFASAVLTRKEHPTRAFDFSLFWSYRSIHGGDPYLVIQIIANIVAFIPISFLLRYCFCRRKWATVLIGLSFSVLIEFLQFVLKRGFTELDDVFHNLLGCLIGYGLYIAIEHLVKNDKEKETY